MANSKTPNTTDQFVGQRVRMARLMMNMSQEKLGEALGVTFQQVQKYEKGTNRIGSSRMQQISKSLQQPVSWFFDEQGGKPGSDIVTQMLTTPHGLELAQSFLAIKNTSVRANFASVIGAMARAGA